MKTRGLQRRNPVRSFFAFLVISTVAALATPLAASGTSQVLAPLPPYQAAQAAAQAGQPEEVAIMWEIDGDGYCSYTPPEGLDSGFQFVDGDRWLYSATNPATLAQGDPMTLTWGFIRDTPGSLGTAHPIRGFRPARSVRSRAVRRSPTPSPSTSPRRPEPLPTTSTSAP